jgi:hypothetical protein
MHSPLERETGGGCTQTHVGETCITFCSYGDVKYSYVPFSFDGKPNADARECRKHARDRIGVNKKLTLGSNPPAVWGQDIVVQDRIKLRLGKLGSSPRKLRDSMATLGQSQLKKVHQLFLWQQFLWQMGLTRPPNVDSPHYRRQLPS